MQLHQSVVSPAMLRTKFTGLRLLWWLSLLIRFDPAMFEKPPKVVKSQDIKERLDHSTVTPDEINNVHFTSRGKVVGSSGKNFKVAIFVLLLPALTMLQEWLTLL